MLTIEIVVFIWIVKMIIIKISLYENNVVYFVYKINFCFNSKICMCRRGLKFN